MATLTIIVTENNEVGLESSLVTAANDAENLSEGLVGEDRRQGCDCFDEVEGAELVAGS